MFVVCVASNCLAVQLVCEGYLCKTGFTKGVMVSKEFETIRLP